MNSKLTHYRISSYEVARALGVSQQTSWFLLHRIREAVQNGSLTKLSGEVEVDETYVGGKTKFMHKDSLQHYLTACRKSQSRHSFGFDPNA